MTSLLTIAKALIALADILPFARVFMDKITDLWVDKQIKKVENKKATLLEKRTALMNSIKEAKTDADRKALSIMLSDLIAGK